MLMQARALAGDVVISVSQNVLACGALAGSRAVGRVESLHPPTALASAGLDAARRALEWQGGHLQLRDAAGPQGCTVEMTVPVTGAVPHDLATRPAAI
jgi:hypothetical protein